MDEMSDDEDFFSPSQPSSSQHGATSSGRDAARRNITASQLAQALASTGSTPQSSQVLIDGKTNCSFL